MSNKKKAKKRTQTVPESKKTFSPKRLIIVIAALVLVAGGITAAIVFAANAPESVANTRWVPVSAKNASTDEAVELGEIYNVYYSNYQGYLEFKDDNTYELWMTPGDPGDGTKSGTYQMDGDKINVKFDDGTKSIFTAKRDGKTIISILVDYGEYKVTFEKEKAAN